ncbi:serine hydrolase domain-containing protein [Aquimarina sediminis]|uniref:serine hydrolase domain-containing protein n=1 Tax=Aquimarina sediminis TaxID=2070536 RepID=UPI000CA05F78|nr:serine hydrolase [Aquimarina sediminis]
MNHNLGLFLGTLILAFHTIYSQADISSYKGQWEGIIDDKNTFNFTVTIEPLSHQNYRLKISNHNYIIDKVVESKSKKHISFDLPGNLKFRGTIDDKKNNINGFLTSGILSYHLLLKNVKNNIYTGEWNILMVGELISQSMFLSVENIEGDRFEAYPFFGDQRFTGTWCTNFRKKEDTISFIDFKTGLRFEGKLEPETIKMSIILAEKKITTVSFKKSQGEWEIGTAKPISDVTNKNFTSNDGWEIADLNSYTINRSILNSMEDSIQKKSLTHVHSVLVAKEKKIVYENYFYSYNQNISHDQRSASKSISSAMIGIAIDHKIIEDVDQSIYNYIPKQYQYTKDSIKSKISLTHLLTMSSGIDAIDFGIDRNSIASENNYQQSQNWLKTVLEAPMIYDPGSVSNYGSANPFLLGVALNNSLTTPLELFMDQKLLSPLGITNYVIQNNELGRPYFGGGMYLTSRDMLKFGQLYLDKGIWNNTRLISEKWIEESFKKHHVLSNTNDKNEYGYLWWHKTYEVKGKRVKSIEARGAGGQYIFVMPELDVVAVITSGNFRNGRYWQPEKIMESYILPAILNP